MAANSTRLSDTVDALLTRRSLLDWLGKATVLALGADLLAACGDGSGSGAPSPGNQEDLFCGRGAEFPFEAGEPPFEDLLVRTIDPQDLATILQSWELAVDGLVENPLVFSFQELLQLERIDQITDFHCVEGWSVLDVPWTGVHLSTLFERVRPLPEATHVTFHCFGDIYKNSLPMPEALEPRTLLAYGIDCATLPLQTRVSPAARDSTQMGLQEREVRLSRRARRQTGARTLGKLLRSGLPR